MSEKNGDARGKVVALGGVFIAVEDGEAWRAWYRNVLGVEFQDFGGAVFANPADGVTTLTSFGADTDYFQPSRLPFMINLVVDDMDAILARAAVAGAAPLGVQDDTYGRFAWLLDPAGLKVELWQPAGSGAA